MSVMKWIVRILLVFLLYVIAGALLPFAFPKKVSEDYSSKVDPSAFYGTGTGAVSYTHLDVYKRQIWM